MLGTILIILLVLVLVGALPTWGHSRNWGYAPSGLLGTILVIDDEEIMREVLETLLTAEGYRVDLAKTGEEGLEAGAAAGAAAASEGARAFSDEEAWDVLEDIPNDSAAAIILLEHHWAVPLRDAVARAGGFRINDAFISPLDLVEIGLHTAEEAEDLHAMATARAASGSTTATSDRR